MSRLSRQLGVLMAPVVTLLLRVPFLAGREGPFGFDPYIHLYHVKAWLRLSSWPVLGGPEDVIPHDYAAWPGCHVLAASVSDLGLDPLGVITWLPTLLLLILDLAIVLVLLRRTGPAVAVLGGVAFGLLDYIFLQTQWYVPELVGLVLISALLLNELTVRRHVLSLLLLLAILVTHHLSFLMALLFWVVLSRSRPDRAQLAMAAMLAVATFLLWDVAVEETGSFPDIQNQLGGVHPALVAVGAMAALMALRWFGAAVVARRLGLPGNASVLDIARERLGGVGTASVLSVVAAVVAIVIAVYHPSVARFDGIGVQPSKLLVLGGGLIFLAYGPLERDLLRVLCAFALVVLLFVANPLMFEFLPLKVRFLDFLYLPGVVLVAAGAFHLASGRPERTRAVLLALLLVCPVLYADDALRYASDESQRFAYTREDLEFVERVGEMTEPEARVVVPFGLSGVVMGVAERRTATHPVRAALDGDGYADALPFLEELAADSPVYLVHSSDATMYIETEDDHVSRGDLERLEATLDLISDRLTLLEDGEGYVLYGFA